MTRRDVVHNTESWPKYHETSCKSALRYCQRTTRSIDYSSSIWNDQKLTWKIEAKATAPAKSVVTINGIPDADWLSYMVDRRKATALAASKTMLNKVPTSRAVRRIAESAKKMGSRASGRGDYCVEGD